MAIVLKDRVKVTSGVVGTGTVTLGAAAVGYQDFSAIGNGNVTYYTIALLSGSEWEVGQGTVTQVTGIWYLSRDFVLESSNAGNLVNFSTGTKDVFVTYPAEKAIFEEPAGNVVFDGGPITVVGNGVTSYTSFSNFFAEMFGNADTYVQSYIQNQNGGSDASADYVALNDIGTDTTYYVDMGMNSSGYTSGTFQIYTPNSGYVYSIGGGSTSKMFVGSADDDLILHAGGFATTNIGLTISGTDQTVDIAKDATVGGTLSVTGAADFASTVLLAANPTLALQAATKQYVDNQVTAGLHIHEPVLVETTGNLTASYTQGGTTFNITDITGAKTLTTSVNHGLSINDQIWLYNTAGNGLSINTAYFVYSTPALNQITVSLTFGGAELTGLTNATGLAYNTRANSGVGAKLTNSGTQVALTIDNVPLALTNRVMVRLQTNAVENGVYTVTTVGTGATNWELTRATDSNKVNPADPNGVGTGDYYFTQDGDINAGDSHVLTTEPNTMIIGYTGLTYTQFSGAVTYTGVAPIDVTGQTISLTGIVAAINGGTGTGTVTTGNLLYGSATNTWSKLSIGAAYKPLLVNAGGTNVEWNALALNQAGTVSGALPIANGGTNLTTYLQGDLIYSSTTDTLAKLAGNTTTTKQFLTQTGTGAASAAPAWGTISAADVSGLAASATTDTTNATNISSGTLPIARLNGSYTGVTGVGALAAGSLATGFTAVSAPLGGTGQSSYAVGDLLYASTTTALSKLADVVAGNALISGGVGAAPAWGKIELTTHVSGTLAVVNGGTGAATLTGYVYGNGTGTMTASTSIPNAATTATSANTASTIVARDASGNFTAGTITAALSGNATTATTAANVNDGTLSLAVSGTGLSGSATFTANQSGNSTFTVASNATSANTASTIVARDASGNFTAGTITAALSGNATSATSATTAAAVANSITFNNGGAGGASGTTYNGNAAPTISYNTIGAPSTTGTNASGTWGINVTGNAATATGSVYSNAVSNTGYGNGNFTWYQDSGTFAGQTGWASYLISNHGSGATYYNQTLIMPFWSAPQYSRLEGGTLKGPYTILSTENYTSYSPSLTGGGASGSWGINITGNAYIASAVAYSPNRTDVAAYPVVWGAAYTSGTGTVAYSCAAVTIQSSTGTLNATNFAASGKIDAPKTFVTREGNQATGINWYASSYSAWTDYMSPPGSTGCGPTANITAPSGTLVTSWALRRFIENSAGYGWTFESGTANQVTPTVVFEILASTGSIRSSGNVAGVTGSFSGQVTQSGDSATIYGPNSSWASYLQVGGNGRTVSGTTYASIATTNGNMHIDSGSDKAMYLNFYSGTAGVNFGNGAAGIVGTMSAGGALNTNGAITQAGNQVLHAGNYSSYAAGLTTSNILTGANSFYSNQNTASGSNPPLQAYGTNSGAMMSFHRGGYYAVNMGLDSDNVMRIGGWSAAANRWQLDMSGNGTYAGNVTAYSDERLKKDWTPLASDFVEKLATVKAGTYTRIDSEERQAGSSAQDWQALLPEVVQEGADEGKTLALAYGNAALVSAVELAKRVVEQDARIAKLEALVAHLAAKA